MISSCPTMGKGTFNGAYPHLGLTLQAQDIGEREENQKEGEKFNPVSSSFFFN